MFNFVRADLPQRLPETIGNNIFNLEDVTKLPLAMEMRKVPNLPQDVKNEIFSFLLEINSELHLINKQSYLMVKKFHKVIFKKVKAAFIEKDIETLQKIRKILFNCHFFYALHYTVESLIETKCDIVRHPNSCGNLLSKAIGEGKFKRVQLAIELGADVHQACIHPNFDGFLSFTPLIGSIKVRKFNIGTYLLNKGADLSLGIDENRKCPPYDDLINLFWNAKKYSEEPDSLDTQFLYKCDFVSGFKLDAYYKRDPILTTLFKRAIRNNTAADLIYKSIFEGYASVSNIDQFIHSIFDTNVAGGIILAYLNPKGEVFSEENSTISMQEYYRRLFELRYDVKMPLLKFF